MDRLRTATHIDPPILLFCMAVWWALWLFIAYAGHKWINWRYGIRR